jgi:uncharacterized membrane protein YfcA
LPIILIALPFVGLFAGVVGTLIGAGGGFILVPILLALFPDEPTGIITGMSQTVVLLNALSGTIAYARQRRIAYKWSATLAATGLVGMVLGAYTAEQLSRERFQGVFAIAVLVLAAYLLVRPVRRGAARSLMEAQQRQTTLRLRQAVPVSLVGLVIGFLGGLLGIGGGIVLVPTLVQVFGMAAHIATATSQLVILLTSPGAIAVHLASVPLVDKTMEVLLLGVGAVVGAQLGARISRRVSGPWLVRILALALIVVGVRLLVTSSLL